MKQATRILIVEDKQSDAELAKYTIQKVLNDCEFQIVETRQDFLNVLEIFQPDVILSDYSLPRFDGMKALNLALEHAPLTPLIIWTGSISEDVAVECMKAGANNYILKDNIKRLGPAVMHALEERQLLLERKQAEESLLNSEKRFRALIENGLDDISLLASDGTLLWESPSIVRNLGYPPDAFVGHNIFELMHPNDLEWTQRLFQELVQKPGSREKGEFRLYRADGTWRWVEAIATNMLNDPGINAIVINYRDVTERKQAGEALRASEARFRTFVDHATDAFFLHDERGTILDVNHQACESLGYSREELIGLTPFEIDADAVPSFVRHIQMQLADQGTVAFDTRHRRKDGTTFPVEVRIRGFQEDGRSFGVALVRDITERKQAEERLRHSENRYRLVTKATNDVIWEWNPTNHQLLWSENAQHVFGYSIEEIGPEEKWWDDHIHPDDRERVLAKLNALIVGNESIWMEEYRFLLKNGSYAYISDRAYIERDANEAPLRMIGAMSNITARKRAEIERQTLLEIMQGLANTTDLQEWLALIHHSVAKVIYAQNFFVVLYNKEDGLFEEIYSVDQYDAPEAPSKLEKSITSYVFRSGQPLLLTKEIFDELVIQGEMVLVGTNSTSWLGAPLKTSGRTIGVMAVQDYENDNRYSERDKEFLASIASQIAVAINHRQASEAVRKSEARYRGLFENLVNGFALHEIVTDDDGKPVDYKFLEINPAFEELTGIHAHEAIRKSAKELLPGIENERFIQIYGQVASTGTPVHFEDFSEQLGKHFEINAYSPERGQFAVTFNDITERKQAEMDLVESITLFRTLFEASPDAIMLLDPHDNWPILDCNTAACEMNGYTRSELIGQSIDILNPATGTPSERASYLERIHQAGVLRVETAHRHKDGRVIPIEVSTCLIALGGRDVILGIDRDISERKRAEEALHQSEALYRQAMEVAGAVPYLETYYDEGRLIKYEFIGEGIRQITGYGPEEFNAKLWDSLVEEVHLVEDLAGYSLEDGIERVRAGENAIWKCEHRLRDRDGKIHWVFEAAVELRDENGISHGSIGTYQDITVRKQAEQAEREQRALAEALRDTAETLSSTLDYGEVLDHILAAVGRVVPHDAATIMLIDGGFAHIVRSYGYDKQGFNADIMGLELPLAKTHNLRQMFETGQTVVVHDTYSYPGWKRMAATDWLRSNVGAPISVQGQVIGFILLDSQTLGFFTPVHAERLEAFANQAALAIHNAHLLQQAQEEITERKRAEEALRAEREKAQKYLDIAGVMMLALDQDGIVTLINQKGCEILGYSADEIMGKNWINTFLPETIREEMQGVLQQLISGDVEPVGYYENTVLTKNGEERLIAWHNTLVRDSEGRIISSLSSGEDITERRRTEGELRASEERFRQLADNIQEAFWMTDAESGEEIYLSSAAESIWERPIERLMNEPNAFINSVFAEDQRAVLQAIEKEKMGEKKEIEYRIVRPDGSVRWVWDRAFPIFDDAGKVKRIAGISADITERREAEVALVKSQSRYRELFDSSPISIWEEDYSLVKKQIDLLLEGGVTNLKSYLSSHPDEVFRLASLVIVTDVNQASLELYSVDHKEYLLKNLTQILGEEATDHFQEEILGLMSPLKRFQWEGADKTLHGKQMDVIVNGSISHGYEEDWSKVIVSIIDITERKQAEQQLRKLSRAVEQSGSTIVITDTSGTIEYVNPRFTEVTGYTLEEVIGKNPRILKSGLTAIEDYKQLWRAITSGNEWRGEMLNKKKDGELFWEYATISPILNEGGEITHFLAVKEDITERKRNETETRRRADEFAALYETARELATQYNLPSLLNTIAERACALLRSPGGGVYLYDEARRDLEMVLAVGSSVPAGARLKMGEGMAGHVAQTQQLLIVDNYHTWEGRALQYEAIPFRAVLQVPMLYGGKLIGVLSVNELGESERKYTEVDAHLLSLFAEYAASAVHAARLLQETQRRLAELEALYENGLAVGRLLTANEIGNRVIDTFARYLEWHHVTIRLRREASDDLELVAFNVPRLKEEERSAIEKRFVTLINKVGHGFSGWVIQTGIPFRTGNVHGHPQYIDTHPAIQSGLYMPLKVGERVIGVISVESETPDAFTEQDERLLATLANQAAIAFENARLYETIQKELSERERAEQALRASEVHYRQLADSITDILFELDQDLHYTHWNKASEMLTGIPAKDAIGKSMHEIFGESEEQTRISQIYESVLKNRQPRTFETTLILNGQKGSFEINAYPSTRGVSVVAKDVTERKRSEIIMQKRFELMEYASHHSLQELMQKTIDEVSELTGSSIGFLHFVDEDQITLGMQTWSTSALQLFHVPFSEGEHLPLDQAGVWAEAARQRRPLIQNDYESLAKKKNLPQGHVPITRELVIPIIRNERIMAIMGIANKPQDYKQYDLEITARLADYAWDITERKQMELALETERNQLAQRVDERTADLSRANSNLARALRVKDEFLANMSHELRTPLNAILGLSESLSEQIAGPLNEKQQKYISTIGESGHHLLSLINDILDLAKIDAGQITLDINKVDIRSVCQASLRMIKQLAQKKNQEVSLEIDESLGLIWADERRLKQMLVNLLGNAVKFTPENGSLGLEVHGDEDANKISFTVWDKGVGIREEDLARLFQPFVQLDSGLARETTGTGLGLALVAQMARLHGGSIQTFSEPDHGSRFTIVLPWEPALAMDAATRMKITGKFRAIQPDEKNKLTILLVEDTREVTMMLKDYLELAGYKVVTAQDGVDAIVQAKLVRPDLILMDVQMPRMDGLEATRKLRTEPDFRYTPIIALTALAMSGDRERCLEAGMDEYISKPINLKALIKIIQECLFSNQEAKS